MVEIIDGYAKFVYNTDNINVNKLNIRIDKLREEIMSLQNANPNGAEMSRKRDEILNAVKKLDTDNNKYEFFMPTLPGRLNKHVANLILLARELKKLEEKY